MDDIIQDFLMETSENLVQLDIDLVSLEQDNNNANLLGNIFRTIHTIKGTCGFIGLPRLEKVAHHGENVLGRFRDGEIQVTPDAITAILQCVDTIKEIMTTLEETGSEPEGDDQELLTKLNAFMEDAPDFPTSENNNKPITESENTDENEADDASMDFTPIPAQNFAHKDTQEETKIHKEEVTIEKTIKIDKIEKKKDPKTDKAPSIANQSIRVNVNLLENLITSVSELVLARNQLLQLARDSNNDEFKVPLQRLNHVTSELQEGLMQTRMQPVGTAWSQLPRIVRDLSQDLKKEIDLEMIGAETELDRQVIEIIKDPLMHMVRNSADHGLESPQDRLDAHKSRKGHIVLKAYHAGGHVVIEINDDGRGLNKDRIVEKIINNKIATQEQVENFSDTQIYNHIFAAGFSTAEKVTNVSGRGVGMDVVRSNIEKIGGSVEVNSTPGEGSVFTVKIPLTLAIVSALIIRSAGQRFAIPQVSIIELVQASQESGHTVEYVNNHPVLRLRDQLLPLVTLSEVLQITEPKVDSISSLSPSENIENNSNITSLKSVNEPQDSIAEDQFIIVAQVGSGQFGIIVDKVYDTEEIVVKPVSILLRSANIFAGNTILGDGSIVMILDPKSISDKAGGMHTGITHKKSQQKKVESPSDRRMRFLLFKAGEGAPKAIPLALIVRLEEVNTKDIESSNGSYVLQYRDRLMPLTSIQGFLDCEEEAQKSVLVFQQNNEYVGLVVDEIIDIVEDSLDIKMNTSQIGSYGSIVVAEKTTDLLDIDHFIQQICPNWHSMLDKNNTTGNLIKNKKTDTTVCFVDGCSLYRNLITPLLELQEINSLAFDAGNNALEYLMENPMTLDAFILDKDSIGQDPSDFFEAYKTSFSHVPCFIVGSSFNAQDEVFFKDNNCIACLSKNDRESILTTIRDYLEQTRSLAA